MLPEIRFPPTRVEDARQEGYVIGSNTEYNSFTYNQSGFKIQSGCLRLSKIGSIKLRLHRHPSNVKQVIVHRDSSGLWFAIATCDIAPPVFRLLDPRKSVGIDVGITKFAHDSNNTELENPLFLTKSIKPLRRAHRRLSRRKPGSNNYGKARHMLSRLYSRIHNRRHNFHHQASATYARKYDIIFLERLQMLNLVKNHRIARHVIDSGWRSFRSMLAYKAKMVVEVGSAYTSVNCSKCDNQVPKKLAMRTHRCDKCGLVIDRDYNASLNILHRGLSLLFPVPRNLPQELREVTLVETSQRSRKQETADVKR